MVEDDGVEVPAVVVLDEVSQSTVWVYFLTLKGKKVKSTSVRDCLRFYFILPDKFTYPDCKLASELSSCSCIPQSKTLFSGLCVDAETFKSIQKCNCKFASECIVLKS